MNPTNRNRITVNGEGEVVGNAPCPTYQKVRTVPGRDAPPGGCRLEPLPQGRSPEESDARVIGHRNLVVSGSRTASPC
jgi:hypothetical protein